MKSVCFDVFCLMIKFTQAVDVRFIVMFAGGGNSNMGFEIYGATYDVAIEDSRRLYPRVFQNFSLTRYFVPGNFTCEDSVAYTTVGLGTLYGDPGAPTRSSADEFRIVLSPGCSFETTVLGDFAREANVPAFASTASVEILNNKRRFPTLLPWASTSFNNMATAVAELMKFFRWTTFNLACDVSKANSFFGVPFEVFSGIMRQVFRTRVRDISMNYIQFDSSKPETIVSMLERCRLTSAIIVIATDTEVHYELVLWNAAKAGMASGEYVFVLLALLQQLDNWTTPNDTFSQIVTEALSLSLLMSFDHINSTGFHPTAQSIRTIAATMYNWTLTEEDEVSPTIVAAYETTMMVSEVLNETFDELENLSATAFAKKFYNRSFILPSRTVSTSAIGTRLSNIWVGQLDRSNLTGGWQTRDIYEYDATDRKLTMTNPASKVRWEKGSFPVPVIPLCGFHHELCNLFWITPTVIGVVLAGLLITLLSICILLSKKRNNQNTDVWYVLDASLYRYKDRRFTLAAIKLPRST